MSNTPKRLSSEVGDPSEGIDVEDDRPRASFQHSPSGRFGSHDGGPRRSLSMSSIRQVHMSPKAWSRIVIPLVILFAISAASATQTVLSHHLNADLGYHQPYFTFYLTHITFSFVFPVHLVILIISRPSIPVSTYIIGIRNLIAKQLSQTDSRHPTWRSIAAPGIKRITWLTMLLSVSALSWFVAVVFTTAMDVTTLYASSSFFAYIFSMLLLKEPLSRITVGSICLAFGGVLLICLAGAGGEEGDETVGASHRVIGDLIMLFGAVLLGLYEVVYKLALPEGQGGVTSDKQPATESYAPLPLHIDPDVPLSPQAPRHAHRDSRGPLMPGQAPPSPLPSDEFDELAPAYSKDFISSLPPALHSNFLTSCIGITTLLLLWIPIPLLSILGIERFRLPGSQGGPIVEMWAELEVVAWGGAVYNAGLMVLIGIWGPTTSSVANLLTIGLVAVMDAVWGGEIPDLQTMIGVAMICVGFGVLLWEGEG